MEALRQQVDHHGHREGILPQDVGNATGAGARGDAQHVVRPLERIHLQATLQGILVHLGHGLVDVEDHVILEHVVGGRPQVMPDIAHAVGRHGHDVAGMHALLQSGQHVRLHPLLVQLHVLGRIEGGVPAVPTQVVGEHQVRLRCRGFPVDELHHVDFGLLGLGQRLALFHRTAERGADAVRGVHAPRLRGQDGSLVILGDVHAAQDAVHHVGG